ncbi:MAG: amino acid adenylation domain-containing protein [Nocardiopsaceae bacterium]|nr:amino acid adenylation domain-containing protein [Nocardiopsaceae bacterium]
MVPLSFAQQRLWFLSRLEGVEATYNIPVAVRLSGPLDRVALERALADVVDRHESLRTVFPETGGDETGGDMAGSGSGGGPSQEVVGGAAAAPELTVIQVGERELPGALAEATRGTFDLTMDLPLRAWLFELGSEEHVLLLVMHHIASDGWSMGPLGRDLGEAYAARREGREPDWEPLPVQYADYALWQRELLGDEDDPDSLAAEQLGYWSKALEGVPEELALPFDRPRPAAASYRGGTVDFTVPAQVHAGLAEAARRHGATMFMVVQAAVAALLSRLGAGTDIPLGTPVAGRDEEATGDLVGFFVNTLVMRADVSEDPRFGELLGRVREVVLEALEHQDLPFERIVEVLNPVRSLARNPLFQVMVAIGIEESGSRLELPGLACEEMQIRLGVAKFDLSFDMREVRGPGGAPRGIKGELEFASDVFDEATAESIAARLTGVLKAVAADPRRRVSDLDIYLPGERERLLREWSGATASAALPAARSQTLAGLFEAQAARTPGAAALAWAGGELSYRELNERANRLARYLIGLGAGPERVVAVALPRGAAAVTALLAVAKSGAAYMPVDPGLPAERIAFMLADVAPVLTVTDAATSALLPETGPTRVVADDPATAKAVAACPGRDVTDADRTAGLRLAHVAYLIYTSGSTGTPKGVAVTHAGLGSLAATVGRLGLGPGSRVSQLAGLGFDAVVMEALMAWPTGACLAVPPPGKLAGEQLAGELEALGVTHVSVTPSALAEVPAGRLPGVECFLVGGEAFVPGLAPVWAEGRVLVNAYGPTESTVIATMSGPLSATGAVTGPVTGSATGAVTGSATGAANSPAGAVTPPVGRPVAHTRVYVLDERLRPVPPGVAGEVYLAGAGLARGYAGRAALTGERFVACPFGDPGERMYRTGDLARWRRDGDLECLGRVDDQVKLRGIRVELGEVRSALARVPGVGQAAVVLREDRSGDKRLVGYVVPAGSGKRGVWSGQSHLRSVRDTGDGKPGSAEPGRPDEPVTGGGVREWMAERLPDYLVPSAVVVLDALPLTANGKLDSAALPAPDYGAGAAGGYVAPRTPEEETVAGAFARVLGAERAGIHDNFFDLGGHSLLAARLANELKKAFGDGTRPVGVMDVFMHPTPAGLAELLARDPGERAAGQALLYELTPPVAKPSLSVVCAPYGGGSASVYQPLARALPPGCSLQAIQPPGHDPALESLESLEDPGEGQPPIAEVAAACAAEIVRKVTGPLVLYGHSGPGVALAVAIALELEAAGRPADAVYLGGVFPFARPGGKFLGLFDGDRLRGDRSVANEMIGMGAEVGDLDKDQLRFVVRAARADRIAALDYFTGLLASRPPALRAPVITVAGGRDPATNYYQERFREWGFLSGQVAAVVIDEAGHYFTGHRAEELAEILTRVHPAIAAGAEGSLTREERGPEATWWLHDSVTIPAEPTARCRQHDPQRQGSQGSGNHGLARFLAVALGQLVSVTGSTLTEFALPVWIYLQTGVLQQFGLLAAVGVLPGLAIGPLAGAITDRCDRRLVMIASGLTAGAAEIALLGLDQAGGLRIWNIYVLVGVLSVAVAFQQAAYASAIPQIVPKRYLGHANGMVQAGNGFGQLVAPLAGAGLLAVIGLKGILAADVASYAVAVGVLAFVRFPPLMALVRTESLMAELAGGYRFILRDRGFRAMIGFLAVGNLFLTPFFILISPLVLTFAHLTDVAYATAAAGVGGLLAGLVMGVWGGPGRRMAGVIACTLGLGLCAVVTGLRPDLPLVMTGCFGMAFALGLANGITATIIQTKVPQRLHGRVFAMKMAISGAAMPLAFAVIAPYGIKALTPLEGQGKAIGLFYVVFGLALALLALAAWRIPVLARFDDAVPDALPDDLLGIEAIKSANQPLYRTDSPDSPAPPGRQGRSR